MADTTISALPAVTNVDPATNVLPIDSSGDTYKATPDQIVTPVLAAPPAIGATTPNTAAFSQINLGTAEDIIWGAGLNTITANDGSGYFLNTDGSFIIQQQGSGLPPGPFFAVDQYGSLGLGTLFANYYGTDVRCITLDGTTTTEGVIDFRQQGTQIGSITCSALALTLASNSGGIAIVSSTTGHMENVNIGAKTKATGAFTDLSANSSVNFATSGTVTIAPTATGTMDDMVIGSVTPNQGYFDKALSITNADGSTPARQFTIAGNGATGSGQLAVTVNNAAGVINFTPTVVGGGVLDGTIIINMGDATVSNWFFAGGDLFTSQGTTDMTNGFLWIPAAGGPPTGTPTSNPAGTAAQYFDQTNNKLYVYNQNSSTWIAIN